jgi:hypothetical protein
MPLPTQNFQWENEPGNVWQAVQYSSKEWFDEIMGYVFEVDLIIPEGLHVTLDDLPLAPEKSLSESIR